MKGKFRFVKYNSDLNYPIHIYPSAARRAQRLFSHRVRPRCIVDAINPTVKWSARLNAAISFKAGLIIHLKKIMQ